MKLYSPLSVIIFIAAGCFLASCGSTPTVDETVPKSYSISTEKEFQAIEKGDTKTPNSNQGNYLKKTKTSYSVPSRPTAQPAAVKEQSKTAELVPENQLTTKNQERLQEINQNLAFFCMKHRKESAFQDEDKCLAFTKRVLLACEKKHKIINTVMVNCIKERLKKRP